MIKEKVALVTGSSRSIGLAVATRLAKEGYAVVMNSRQPAEAVREAIDAVKAFGHPVIYLQGDLASTIDRDRMVGQLMQDFGRIDLLVNNAGVGPKVRLDILETTEESMDFVLGINLRGTFFLSQAIANIMIGEKRKNPEMDPMIINISSMSAYTTSLNRGEYCISKAGVSMITQLFADRLAPEGIRVYEIRPGIIETELTAKVHDKYDPLIQNGLLPIKRWGQPEDIAQAIFTLSNGGLLYSTGDVLNVDGGFHLRRF
ncbi:MAG TPA: 3-ketoacyl-ACP reductase [Negativicutes bacterium]|nr:3-ketoacyl-ACP reductase [Negativicutes bacterium]